MENNISIALDESEIETLLVDITFACSTSFVGETDKRLLKKIYGSVKNNENLKDFFENLLENSNSEDLRNFLKELC